MNDEAKNLIDQNCLVKEESIISTGSTNIADSSNDVMKFTHEVRPWVRYFARIIDNLAFAFVLGIFGGIFFPGTLPKSDLILGPIVLFVWIFFEPFCLIIFGTTFGKWLLRIKLRTIDDKKLSLPIALKRSFAVWLKGLAIGAPLICLFTLTSAYSDLTRKGITSWDNEYGLKVTYSKIGFIRISIIILVFLIIFSPISKS